MVAHQTATSAALIDRARGIAAADSAADFALLIPATHPKHLLHWDAESRFVWDERNAYERARMVASESRAAFEAAGLRVANTIIGDESPVLATEDELRARPDRYQAIVLSTLPARRSRWLADRVAIRLEQLGLPVIHVSGAPRRAGMRLSPRIPIPIPRWLAQTVAMSGERRGNMTILLLMALYLAGSAALAVTVNRAFFLNDAIAMVVFSGFLLWLVPGARRLFVR